MPTRVLVSQPAYRRVAPEPMTGAATFATNARTSAPTLFVAVTWLLAGCAAPLPAGDTATPPARDSAPIVSAAPEPAAAVAPVAKPVESGKVVTDTMEKTIGAAVEDAAYRSGLPRESIKVISSARVTWSDGSLGCPEPGMLYTQALVRGYRIIVHAGGKQYEYHAGLSGPPRFCPADRVQPPARTASSDLQ